MRAQACRYLVVLSCGFAVSAGSLAQAQPDRPLFQNHPGGRQHLQLCSGPLAKNLQEAPAGHLFVGKPMSREEVVKASLAEIDSAKRRLASSGQIHGKASLRSDLAFLTSDPCGRDCTGPTYHAMALWAAGRLQEQGVLPAGSGRLGLARYLEPFEWDQYYGNGRARSENVIGIRRGSGNLDEAVLVVGHLDGLSKAEKEYYEKRGRRMTGYRGANDNATSIAVDLYISDALAALERGRGRALRRDVIFLLTAAEEEGLKGADAFVRYAEQFYGKKIVGVVNFEMVGRGDPDKVKIFGGENKARAVSNPLYNRALQIRHRGTMARLVPGHDFDNDNHWFERSDHYLMHKAGVPAVMYFGDSGDYHTPADNLDALDFKTLKAVSRHALRLVMQLADDPKPSSQGATLPFQVKNDYTGKVYPVSSSPEDSQ